MGMFPTTALDIDAEFLTGVLGETVEGVTHHPIGNGLVGDSARFEIAYADRNASAPTSIAAKFPAADPTSRATAQAMRLYEREVGFYRNIAPHVATRTPQIYAAEYDAQTSDFLLLMEDLGPAKQGDQLEGCSFEEAMHCVRELAALHGPSYAKTDLIAFEFLKTSDEVRQFLTSGFVGACEAFRTKFGRVLDPKFLDIVARCGEKSAALWDRHSEKHDCIIHGDFRLDNIMFAVRGDSEPMATLDWQTVTSGDPLLDLGYFMGAGIGAELRASHGDALIAEYASALVKQGGPQLSDITGSDGYAHGALRGVVTAVFSAAFVEDNERAKAIFKSMADGSCSLVQEIDALRVLEN